MKYDAIVVGLGAMGSASAYQLAKRGANVLGIDRYAPPHIHGSTHGDTRITRLAIGEGAQYTPLVIRSHEIWREIERETGADLLRTCGGLVISSNDNAAVTHVKGFFQNTVDAARKHGIAHELLDAAEIRRRYRCSRSAIRSSAISNRVPASRGQRPACRRNSILRRSMAQRCTPARSCNASNRMRMACA